MAERTPAADSEKVEETASDETQEIDAISAETSADTQDGSEIERGRVKRNIIDTPERTEKIIDGVLHRRDANGKWRLLLD